MLSNGAAPYQPVNSITCGAAGDFGLLAMAFHRHTGTVGVLPGVVGLHLVNGEESFAKRLLCQRNNFECRLKPQQSAAVTPDGKRADNQWEAGAGAECWWWPRLFCEMHWILNVFVSAAVGRLGVSCYLSKTW